MDTLYFAFANHVLKNTHMYEGFFISIPILFKPNEFLTFKITSSYFPIVSSNTSRWYVFTRPYRSSCAVPMAMPFV